MPLQLFVDDTCSARVSHTAVEGDVYLIQLTYQGDGVCQVSCYLQTRGDDGAGEMEQEPCP